MSESRLPEDAMQPNEPVRRYAFEDWIAFAVFWALTGVVFLQFSARYFGLGSFPWTEEGARYLLILLAFFGAGLAIRRRSHVAVTMLQDRLALPLRIALEILIAVLCVVFYATAAWFTYQVGFTQGVQRMASLNIPLRFIYWTISACLVLLTVRSAVQSYTSIAALRRRPES